MAKALQCPDCGTRHPVDEVAHLKTFRCHECRRLLKVPAAVAAEAAPKNGGGGGAESPKAAVKPSTRKAAAAGGAAGKAAKGQAKTPPSKRTASTELVTAAGAAGGKRVPPSQRGNAIADQTAKFRAVDAPAGAPSTRTRGGAGRAPRVSKWVRAAAWTVAVPLGLIPVLIAGRFAGVLSMDRAVDVFVGVGWGRFLPPLLLLPVWSAATATVAHLILERAGRNLPRR